MLRMEIPVVLESLRRPDEKSKAKSYAYADFVLMGGNLNIPLTSDQYKEFRDREGDEILCLFAMKARSIVQYNRPACVFEVVKLLEIKE
jgi:hypothetical protein